uniref:Bestrophin homolog n=1 Tax=Parascaris univalens TaxID=6257 RepID=A0A915CET2_PARUN
MNPSARGTCEDYDKQCCRQTIDSSMTISYTLDMTQTGMKSFIKLMVRWRGSVWKSVLGELIIWTVLYFTVSLIYRFLLGDIQKRYRAILSNRNISATDASC